MTIGIAPGDEVLCPSFTFFSTAGCISRLGAEPVFVDVLPNTFNINVDDAVAKISPRTRQSSPSTFADGLPIWMPLWSLQILTAGC